MKDYYQILGVDEFASQEEIEARWVELRRHFPSSLYHGEDQTAERIEEVSEAYEVLKDPLKRKEYDLQRILRRATLKRIHERREQRQRRKKLLVPGGAISLLLLVAGYFLLLRTPSVPIPQKPATPTYPPVSGVETPTSISKPVPLEMPKVSEGKPSQPAAQKIARSEERVSPVPKPPKKEAEIKEKIAKERAKTERPIAVEGPRVEAREQAPVQPQPATTYVPPPEKPQKSEVTPVIEPKTSEIMRDRVPKEMAKEVQKEELKEPPKAPPREEPKAVTREVSRILPKEAPKTISPELPALPPSRPKEVKPSDQTGKVGQPPSPKPAAPLAAIPPMPHPFVKEQEIREFLTKYVDRYKERDLEGFLSLFSPRVIQNQKDGMEGIRKIYSRQFELYERFEYQLRNPKIEILEEMAKVRASYEITQFPKKGEVRQLQGEIEWDLVKEGGELKILAIQYQTVKSGRPTSE